MFTYDAIGTLTEFTLLRPIFITILAMMIVSFLTVVVPKFRSMYGNVFPILYLSVASLIASAQLLFFNGVLVDELVLSGDSVSFFLFIGIGALVVLNPCVYLWKANKGINV